MKVMKAVLALVAEKQRGGSCRVVDVLSGWRAVDSQRRCRDKTSCR